MKKVSQFVRVANSRLGGNAGFRFVPGSAASNRLKRDQERLAKKEPMQCIITKLVVASRDLIYAVVL